MPSDPPEWMRNLVFLVLTLIFFVILFGAVYLNAEKYSNDKEQNVHQESNNHNSRLDEQR